VHKIGSNNDAGTEAWRMREGDDILKQELRSPAIGSNVLVEQHVQGPAAAIVDHKCCSSGTHHYDAASISCCGMSHAKLAGMVLSHAF
jgi:hypothetical protein